MAFAPFRRSVRRIEIWQGLCLEYVSFPAGAIPRCITVGLEVVDAMFHFDAAIDSDAHLLFILSTVSLENGLNQQMGEATSFAATLKAIDSLPFSYSFVLTDASLLHLVQLLQNELEKPQLMSQAFVQSIATVIILHLLQDYFQQR